MKYKNKEASNIWESYIQIDEHLADKQDEVKLSQKELQFTRNAVMHILDCVKYMSSLFEEGSEVFKSIPAFLTRPDVNLSPPRDKEIRNLEGFLQFLQDAGVKKERLDWLGNPEVYDGTFELFDLFMKETIMNDEKLNNEWKVDDFETVGNTMFFGHEKRLHLRFTSKTFNIPEYIKDFWDSNFTAVKAKSQKGSAVSYVEGAPSRLRFEMPISLDDANDRQALKKHGRATTFGDILVNKYPGIIGNMQEWRYGNISLEGLHHLLTHEIYHTLDTFRYTGDSGGKGRPGDTSDDPRMHEIHYYDRQAGHMYLKYLTTLNNYLLTTKEQTAFARNAAEMWYISTRDRNIPKNREDINRLKKNSSLSEIIFRILDIMYSFASGEPDNHFLNVFGPSEYDPVEEETKKLAAAYSDYLWQSGDNPGEEWEIRLTRTVLRRHPAAYIKTPGASGSRFYFKDFEEIEKKHQEGMLMYAFRSAFVEDEKLSEKLQAYSTNFKNYMQYFLTAIHSGKGLERE